MTAIPHFFSTGHGDVQTLTAFDEFGEQPVHMADSNHPQWNAIVEGVQNGDRSVFDLFDVAGGVMKRFRQITDRVSFDGANIRFDGDVVHSTLANQVARAVESGESDYEPLVKFWEKLESNPNEHSREQAYDWLATHDFKITPEGDVVAYKGVVAEGNGQFFSSSASYVADRPSAIVDGREIAPKSRVPQNLGSVVSMPRSEVLHDPNQHCARGLHVGDWSYANNFARGAVLEVHVNPRDIVSVPNDHGYRKVRVCRYKVVNVVEAEYDGGPVLRPSEVAPTWEGDVGYRVY